MPLPTLAPLHPDYIIQAATEIAERKQLPLTKAQFEDCIADAPTAYGWPDTPPADWQQILIATCTDLIIDAMEAELPTTGWEYLGAPRSLHTHNMFVYLWNSAELISRNSTR